MSVTNDGLDRGGILGGLVSRLRDRDAARREAVGLLPDPANEPDTVEGEASDWLSCLSAEASAALAADWDPFKED